MLTSEDKIGQVFGVLQHVPVGVLVLCRDNTIAFWNQCLVEWTGIEAQDVVGRDLFAQYPHLSNGMYQGRFRSIFEGGPPLVFSSQLHKQIIPSELPGGALRVQHTTVTSVNIEDDSDPYALFVIEDVTDMTKRIHDYRIMRDEAFAEIQKRERIEQQLQQAHNELEMRVAQRTEELAQINAKLQEEVDRRQEYEQDLRIAHEDNLQILEAISSVLIGLDGSNCIIKWNRAAEELFGLPTSVVLGQALAEVDLGMPCETILDALQQCRDSRAPVRLNQVEYGMSDADTGIMNLSFNPIGRAGSHAADVLILGVDMTEQTVLQTQLNQAQKLEAVGQLAAGIAHEINTPTQYVGDNTQFLKETFSDLLKLMRVYQDLLDALQDGHNPDTVIEEIRRVAQRADVDYLASEIPLAIEQSLDGIAQVTDIVRAMKDFAHPDGDRKSALDVNQAIASAITIARNEWKYIAELETHFAENIRPILCHPGQFNQVILNLLINAAHAIEESLHDDPHGKGTITIYTKQDEHWTEIRISDTGCGIDPAICSQIFNPFFTTKGIGKGTGQGLAIARNIIEVKHAGTIDFESEPGQGTTFTFRLPTHVTNKDKD